VVRYLDRPAFDGFLRSLVDAGYELIGPTVRDGAIVLDRIDGAVDLPAVVGWWIRMLVIQACLDGRRCPILSTGAELRGYNPECD
jgi:hypothetical protein